MEQQVDKGTPEREGLNSVSAEASTAEASTVIGESNTVIAPLTLEERIEELERNVIFLERIVERLVHSPFQKYGTTYTANIAVVYG